MLYTQTVFNFSDISPSNLYKCFKWSDLRRKNSCLILHNSCNHNLWWGVSSWHYSGHKPQRVEKQWSEGYLHQGHMCPLTGNKNDILGGMCEMTSKDKEAHHTDYLWAVWYVVFVKWHCQHRNAKYTVYLWLFKNSVAITWFVHQRALTTLTLNFSPVNCPTQYKSWSQLFDNQIKGM